MFGSYIDDSGITAFKTVEAMRKMQPKWQCPKCGAIHTEEGLECGTCDFKRPDKSGIIASRMLWDLEEKLEDYMNGGMFSEVKHSVDPKIFHRYLFAIAKHCENHNIGLDMLRESTREAVKGLPRNEEGKLDIKLLHKEGLV